MVKEIKITLVAISRQTHECVDVEIILRASRTDVFTSCNRLGSGVWTPVEGKNINTEYLARTIREELQAVLQDSSVEDLHRIIKAYVE